MHISTFIFMKLETLQQTFVPSCEIKKKQCWENFDWFPALIEEDQRLVLSSVPFDVPNLFKWISIDHQTFYQQKKKRMTIRQIAVYYYEHKNSLLIWNLLVPKHQVYQIQLMIIDNLWKPLSLMLAQVCDPANRERKGKRLSFSLLTGSSGLVRYINSTQIISYALILKYFKPKIGEQYHSKNKV